MKRVRIFYQDFYGCTGILTVSRDDCVKLSIYTPYGDTVHKKVYKSYRGARIAMGRLSDGWNETGRKYMKKL